MKCLAIAACVALLFSAAANTWYVFDANTDSCVTSKAWAAQEGIPSIVNP